MTLQVTADGLQETGRSQIRSGARTVQVWVASTPGVESGDLLHSVHDWST
jgi:hypothetical protein